MIADIHQKFEKIMIIDDNNIDLFIASQIILKNNFGKIIFEYSVAKEALQYLMDNQENISELPNVIFVDIYMPEMSGFEFMEVYDKLSPVLKNYCKVFIISSTIDDNDIARAYNDKNVVAFQVKPLRKEFLNRINAE